MYVYTVYAHTSTRIDLLILSNKHAGGLSQIHSHLFHVLALFTDDCWIKKMKPLLTVSQWLTSHSLYQLVTNQKVPNDQTDDGRPLEHGFNPGGTVGQSQLSSQWLVDMGSCIIQHDALL